MARARSLKPSLFKNEILGEADPLLTILFEGLWCLADREGRLEDRPKRIKAEIFPYRETPGFNGYLTDLARLGFIHRYEVSGERYIEVINFKKHQSPHKTEKPSEIPPPPKESVGCRVTEEAPLDNRERTVNDHLTPDSLLLTPDSLEKDARAHARAEPSKRSRKQAKFELPDWLDEQAWDRWCQHRVEIRKTLKPSQVRAQFNKLDAYRSEGHDPAAVIDHSIAGGYQGLFPPDKRRSNGTANGFETSHDRIHRLNSADAAAGSDDGAAPGGDGAVVDQDGRRVRR